MTTTELIELLIQNEKGGISHKSREISLTINGKYMSNPQITLSSTGDGICGAEIDLDIDGDFMEEQAPETGHWINKSSQSACGVVFHRIECSECGELSGLSHTLAKYCPNCGAKMESEG